MGRLAKLSPKVVLGAAWLWLIIYAYPGQLTQDSVDHLTEVRSRVYTDAHPPAINLLWRILEIFISGPFAILALQSTMFLIGLYLVFRRTMSERKAAWATAAMFVYPPVIVPLAVIWKDCLMAGGLLLGVAAFSSERRAVRVLGLAAMFLASAVRYNALAATLPLIVLGFQWSLGTIWWKRYATSVAVWLGVTAGAFALNARLTDVPMYYWHSSLAVYDITGTIVHMDPPPSDAEVERLVADTGLQMHQDIVAKMDDVYSARNFASLIAETPKRLWILPAGGTEPPPKTQRDAITAAWKRVVGEDVGAYLRHRFAVMQQVMGLGRSPVVGMVVQRTIPWPAHYVPTLGLSTNTSKLQERLTAAMTWIAAKTPLFTPWIYFVLALILMPLVLRMREQLALLLSGLALEGSLLFLAPSADYRYSHWMVVTVVIAIIVVVDRRYSMRVAAMTKHSESPQASAQ